MTEDRVSKALRHLWWVTGVTVPPQHVGRGQRLWLWSNSTLLRSAQNECTHHSVTRREMQGGMVRLQPSLGHFTCGRREALLRSPPSWWEEKEVVMGALLHLGQTAGGWSPSVVLRCGGPCPCVSSLPREHQSHQAVAPSHPPVGRA